MSAPAQSQLALFIDRRRHELAGELVDQHFQAQPDLEQRYGSLGRAKCREDALYHLAYLSDAILVDRPALFAGYVAWAQVVLAERRIPAADLQRTLQVLSAVLEARLTTEQAATANRFLEAGLAQLSVSPSPPAPELPQASPHAGLCRQYLDLVLRGAGREAYDLILSAVRDGLSVRDLYLHVFQTTQREIGRLWQLNQISVAQEHFCTAVTQFIMSQFYREIFSAPRAGRRLVAACVGDELHEIGMRMVSDFFELDGWDTHYLGANVPAPAIVQALSLHQADVLALSATMTYHLRAVANTIQAIRASLALQHVKIIVGGYPLILEPAIWQSLGADGSAPDAESAVALANRLVAGSSA